ncbi:MAG TPA: type VII secretion-associated protein [Mycobacterium sp.]|uniref:type VII secretion-associated protein n=1 Tax=Mycobacterium sp. TaxID=1785 RepID=UPI002F3E92F3
MRAHIVEIGPNAIRRLCCGGATVADSETERAAFEGIDDRATLVDLRPVTVESVWRAVLAAVDCGTDENLIVVHPSWWPSARIAVVNAATEVFAGDSVMRPRSWLLAQASPAKSELTTLVVEIVDDFVVITGATVVAEARRPDQQAVADAVVRATVTMASDTTAAVVVDGPRTVNGAGPLAALIADGLRDLSSVPVLKVGDIELRKLAGAIVWSGSHPRGSSCDSAAEHARGHLWKVALMLPLIGALVGAGVVLRHPAPRVRHSLPTTFLVEGHVALEVPAQWLVRRVVAGPGSARVQITSPADPEVALHVTQSRVALTTLDATAEFLKSAIDAAPAGVFVDFNPADRSAGRAAVTYREIRSGHDVRWTVWVDKAVRISIGCQTRHGHDDAVNHECEVAVRSARAVD